MRYYVVLFFVYLQKADLSIQRVASRVRKGGHNIPTEVIRRRYQKGIDNFVKYSDAVDDCYLYDNSNTEYELIAKYVDDQETIINFEVFNKIIPNHE